MPPKTAPVTGGKQYDEIVVVVLLMALKSSGSAANPWLRDMAALDGTRTPSGFEHALRAANKLAGELLEKKKKGEELEPGDVGRSVSSESRAATPRKRKGGADRDDGPANATKKARNSSKQGHKAVDSANEEEEDLPVIKVEDKGFS